MPRAGNTLTLEKAILPCILIAFFTGLIALQSPRFLTDLESSSTLDWSQMCSQFYDEACKAISDEITQNHAESSASVYIAPEEQSPDYLSSSPCNKDLATRLYRLIDSQRSEDPSIYYWSSPLAPIQASRLLTSALYRGHWYRSTGSPSGDTQVNYQPNSNGLHVRLAISSIRIDRSQERFEARFQLQTKHQQETSSSNEWQTLLNREYNGNLSKIRWFLRARSHTGLALFSILAVSVFLTLLIRTRNSYDTYPGTVYGLAFMILAQLIFLALVFLSPVPRHVAHYYDTGNLFYLVDTTSEVWGVVPQENQNPKLTAGVDTMANALEERLRKLVKSDQGDRFRSFWTWLRSGLAFAAVYEQRAFRLNEPFETKVFSYSGASTNLNIGLPVKNAPPPRESRLILPVIELKRHSLITLNDSAQNFVVILTPASAPTDLEIKRYFSLLKTNTAYDANTIVLTLHVPSLPMSGDPAPHNYQDGKLALAAISSDFLISVDGHVFDTNQWYSTIDTMNSYYNLAATPETLSNSVERLQIIQLNNPLKIKPPAGYPTSLSHSNRSQWDQPRDLHQLRSGFLLWDPQEIEQTLNEIEQIIQKELKLEPDIATDSAVHVIGKSPLLILLLVTTCLLGYQVFLGEVNGVFYQEFSNSKAFKLAYFASAPVSFLVFSYVLLGWIWQTSNVQHWVSTGSSHVAMLTIVLCWMSWIVAPILFFYTRVHGLQVPKASRIVAIACIVAFAFSSCDYLWISIDVLSPSVRFWILPFVVTILVFLLAATCRGDDPMNRIPGILEWWRYPWLSLSLKTYLAFSLVLLSTAAYPANANTGNGFLHWVSYQVGYVELISFATLCLHLAGVALSFSSENFKYSAIGLALSLPLILAAII